MGRGEGQAIVREGAPWTGAQAGVWAEQAPAGRLQGAQDGGPGAAKAGGARGRGREKAAAWHRWLEHSTYTGGQGLRGGGTLMPLPN